MRATITPTANGTTTNSSEAARILSLLVRINRLRDELRELAGDPDVEAMVNASDIDGGDLDQFDAPLHQIADAAGKAYSRLMTNAG